MTEHDFECTNLDELLPSYMEGDLDAGERELLDKHIARCIRCRSLVADIGEITSDAGSLPVLVPEHDLWPGIQAEILSVVVPINRNQRAGYSRRSLGLAAAALIVVSSSITYVAARGGNAGEVLRTAPASSQVEGGLGETNRAATEAPAGVSESLPGVRATPLASGTETRAGRGELASSVSPPVVTSASEQALAPEIFRLQTVLNERRAGLDKSTVQIVEENLAMIDAAVKQARAALLRDPASGFLTERLDDALRKKVELLRTAALLPSRS